MSGLSSSIRTASDPRRPSLATTLSARSSIGRRISTLSIIEQGQLENANPEDQVVAEEIDEIKRYEDFTTIDWVRDAAREQQRRKAQKQHDLRHNGQHRGGWRQWLLHSYDAGQAWIVVSLVGMAIGLIAACLNIITEWLSDIKMGHCTTAFYLNKSFCCWGAEDGWYQEVAGMGTLADSVSRLRGMASLEFSHPCKLCILHSLLGMPLRVHCFTNLLLPFLFLTSCRLLSPSLLLGWSSRMPLMPLAQVSPRSSASSQALS